MTAEFTSAALDLLLKFRAAEAWAPLPETECAAARAFQTLSLLHTVAALWLKAPERRFSEPEVGAMGGTPQ